MIGDHMSTGSVPGTAARTFRVDEREYPFRDHWLVRQGGTIHYVDEGRGPAVLMVHGNPTWSFLYRDVIRGLGAGVRCIAPDLPGFGFSTARPGYGFTPQEHADELAALIDHLGLDRYVLVVQDWGGPIGLAAALRRPERIAGVVNLGTWCWKSDLLTTLFSLVMGSGWGRKLYLEKSFMTAKFLPSGISRAERKRPEILGAYSAQFPTPGSRLPTWIFARSLRASSPWVAETGKALAALADAPFEIVWPRKGWPGFWLERWKRAFPRASVDVVEGAGHYIQEDAPERVVAGIRRALARG
jgi:haloalkane dehalogenase